MTAATLLSPLHAPVAPHRVHEAESRLNQIEHIAGEARLIQESFWSYFDSPSENQIQDGHRRSGRDHRRRLFTSANESPVLPYRNLQLLKFCRKELAVFNSAGSPPWRSVIPKTRFRQFIDPVDFLVVNRQRL